MVQWDCDKKILLDTNASDLTSAGILRQYDNDGIIHPIVFYLKKHSPAEVNYEIYDKRLMAIIPVKI